MLRATQWPPPDEIGDRAAPPARSPLLDLQDKEKMVGSIDPRRETLRAIQWRFDAATLFGTPVAEINLASGANRANRPDTWTQAINPKSATKNLQARGRPHMDRHAAKGPRDDVV